MLASTLNNAQQITQNKKIVSCFHSPIYSSLVSLGLESYKMANMK